MTVVVVSTTLDCPHIVCNSVSASEHKRPVHTIALDIKLLFEFYICNYSHFDWHRTRKCTTTENIRTLNNLNFFF